jgi:hypothetical protein
MSGNYVSGVPLFFSENSGAGFPETRFLLFLAEVV